MSGHKKGHNKSGKSKSKPSGNFSHILHGAIPTGGPTMPSPETPAPDDGSAPMMQPDSSQNPAGTPGY